MIWWDEFPSGSVATMGWWSFLAGNPRASRIVGSLMAHVPEGAGAALPSGRLPGRLLVQGIFVRLVRMEGYQRWLLEQEGACSASTERSISPDVCGRLRNGNGSHHRRRIVIAIGGATRCDMNVRIAPFFLNSSFKFN
jgi:alkylated DNA nucleotide flippase Atl1